MNCGQHRQITVLSPFATRNDVHSRNEIRLDSSRVAGVFPPARRDLVWCTFLAAFVLAAFVLTAVSQPACCQEPTGLDAALALERVFVDVVARCERSVVAVARARKGPGADKLTDPTFMPNEFGTGVVVDRNGLVLTNLHVLGDPQLNDYAVWLKRRPFRATVKATDPWSDLAVLEIEADDLTPITFGNAGDLSKGQIVISLGNPYGIAHDGEVSVCWGIVSNLLRKAPPEPDANRPNGLRNTVHQFGTLIQTDAKLHLGTSGGALINLRGEMVGLTTSLAARAGYEKSIGYAIPVSEAFRRAVDTLKQGREVEHGLLGVVPGTGSRDLAYDSRRRGEFGVKVLEVFDGTPAEKSSLRNEDLITHIDGRPVYDADHLIMRVGSLPAGKDVELTVQRVSSRSTRILHDTVRLSKKAPDPDRLPVVTAGVTRWRGLRIDHATAIPGFAARRYIGQVDPRGCVGIVDIEPGSAAFKAGLAQGMFVSHVDGRRVSQPDEFHAVIARAEGDVPLKVSSERGEYVTRIVPEEDGRAAKE
jgi:serine protease Do